MSYDNEAEMTAVLGKYDDNSFLKDISKQTAEYEALFASRLG
jgi:hypothetical protein